MFEQLIIFDGLLKDILILLLSYFYLITVIIKNSYMQYLLLNIYNLMGSCQIFELIVKIYALA